MRRIPLRGVLTLLVLATVLPLGVLTAALMLNSWRDQRSGVDRQNVEFARAVSVAIDEKIESTIGALEALAATNPFYAGDREEMAALAGRLVPNIAGWHSVVVLDPSGAVLLDTAAGPADLASGAAWVRSIVESRQPGVSDLLDEEGVAGFTFFVGVPQYRGEVVTSVLAARLRSDALSEILARQSVPPGGVVTLLDRTRRIMARSRNEPDYIGRAPTARFAAAADAMDEGTWRDNLLEGTPVYAALSTSRLTGWTVGIGLPVEQAEGLIRQRAWLLAVAWAAMTGLGAGLALVLGRMLVRSLDRAGDAARALAAGQPVTLARSSLEEVDRLSSSLRQASEVLERRSRERDEAEAARAHAAAQREAALAAEQAARREAEEANRLKEEFLMTASHELRTPLTAIAGWARMLATGEIRDSQRQRAAEMIDRNARTLTLIVNDLLDASRAASGKLRLDVRRVDPAQIVSSAIDAMLPAAFARRIHVVADVPPDAGEVMGDENRLHQVVWNLLSNAFKFSPDGATVRIRLERLDGQVQVAVSDEGPGIDPDFLPFVFDRFRQGPRRPGQLTTGLGLGLAIVRHLVELHGGRAEAENNADGRGATFRVSLPLAAPDPPGMGAGEPPEPPRALLQGTRVLVVTGDLHDREAIAFELERAGAEVRALASADEAASLARTWLPAVVVCDAAAAAHDGLAGIGPGNDDREEERPLLIAVHVNDPDQQARIRVRGFQWQLQSPLDPADLVALIAGR